jgi:hypothetical protein
LIISKSMPGWIAQTEALDADFDDVRTADQDRLAPFLLPAHLGGAQHALVFAIGIDDAHRLLGLREDRLHHQAGAEDEALSLSI